MGTLYIVATPIGNLEDITIRAIKTLFTVDIIACEDTRRTSLLFQELVKRYSVVIPGLTRNPVQNNAGSRLGGRDDKFPTLVRFDEHTEDNQTPELIEQLMQGKNIALVSDAGTPLVSDPGYKLVREAIKRGIKAVSIPGSTAAIAALSSSGLPTDKFFFLGYPPEKSSHRIKLFQNLLQMSRFISSTYILYCAPHKLGQTLEDMKSAFGDIEIVVARELTKVHEEVWQGTIDNALRVFIKPKGEIVMLFRIP